MMILSIVGIVVLVVLVALVVIGATWIVKNVNFKQTEKKEDTK